MISFLPSEKLMLIVMIILKCDLFITVVTSINHDGLESCFYRLKFSINCKRALYLAYLSTCSLLSSLVFINGACPNCKKIQSVILFVQKNREPRRPNWQKGGRARRRYIWLSPCKRNKKFQVRWSPPNPLASSHAKWLSPLPHVSRDVALLTG